MYNPDGKQLTEKEELTEFICEELLWRTENKYSMHNRIIEFVDLLENFIDSRIDRAKDG